MRRNKAYRKLRSGAGGSAKSGRPRRTHFAPVRVDSKDFSGIDRVERNLKGVNKMPSRLV